MLKPLSALLVLALFFGACHKNSTTSRQQVAPESSLEKCRMNPPWLTLHLPEKGFVAANPDAVECNTPASDAWKRHMGKSYDLMLVADGPAGSGRYWTITVAVIASEKQEPVRGLCLETSTGGWRSLQGFERAGLPWAEDLNGDGDPELIFWESFSLSDSETMYDVREMGLMAWVYRTDSYGKFELDWEMSRRFARRIAAAYRSSAPSPDLKIIRQKAALALEAFADGTCIADQKNGQ